ncbi:hypothetical protein OAO87_01605 [bacterium]|nr:hypothetical protein [bacterium]
MAHAPQPAHSTPTLCTPLGGSPHRPQAVGRLTHWPHAPTLPCLPHGAVISSNTVHAVPLSPTSRTVPMAFAAIPLAALARLGLPEAQAAAAAARVAATDGDAAHATRLSCSRQEGAYELNETREHDLFATIARAPASDARSRQPRAADGQRGRDARARTDVRRAATCTVVCAVHTYIIFW